MRLSTSIALCKDAAALVGVMCAALCGAALAVLFVLAAVGIGLMAFLFGMLLAIR